MLEGGLSTVPQPQDTEKYEICIWNRDSILLLSFRPKYYVPRNPFPTAAYYPAIPLALLQTPAIFTQLDVETLFWVFYYLPGTYQQ